MSAARHTPATTPQVPPSHYDFLRYVGPDRWQSYYEQIALILQSGARSVLEVGAGEPYVRDAVLRASRGSIRYETLDIDPALNPTYVGPVQRIPVPAKRFDIVCAFEVLEHIPFEEVPQALSEMRRVARKAIYLSVPHFGPQVRLELKIPLLPRVRFLWKIPYPKRHHFNGEHYWELGKRGFPPRRFRSLLAEVGTIEREFIPFANPYHHFFVVSVAG